MADFIDRQATINAIGLTTDAIKINPVETKYVDAQGNELVAVVRCKDCTRYVPFKDIDGVCLAHNKGALIIMSQNGYCNLGVSREDETD